MTHNSEMCNLALLDIPASYAVNLIRYAITITPRRGVSKCVHANAADRQFLPYRQKVHLVGNIYVTRDELNLRFDRD